MMDHPLEHKVLLMFQHIDSSSETATRATVGRIAATACRRGWALHARSG